MQQNDSEPDNTVDSQEPADDNDSQNDDSLVSAKQEIDDEDDDDDNDENDSRGDQAPEESNDDVPSLFEDSAPFEEEVKIICLTNCFKWFSFAVV